MVRKAALVQAMVTVLLLALILVVPVLAQQSLRVRVDRWLEVRSVKNNVTIQHDSIRRAANVGDRLSAVGDSIATGKQSTATLGVDTGIGVIEMAEQTTLRVQALDIASDNGRITRLEMLSGNARLKIRRFTHQGSELDIRTPASLSGVRGTQFGLSVQPNGKTGLAVAQGKVASAAQGKAVGVAGGFQNFTIPGESPSLPVPLKNDTSLTYEFERIIESGVRKVRLMGRVDAVNAVLVNGAPQVTDRNGRFVSDLQLVPSYLRIQVIVITPLGLKKTYELALQ